MKMTWVVVANSNQYRIYHYHRKDQILALLQECQHPENKCKEHDILSDRQGRYATNHAAHGAYTQPVDPMEESIDRFARNLADALEQGRNQNAFDALILIIPPDMEGRLLHHLNKHVKPLIQHVIQKNIVQCDEKALLECLHKYT